MTTFPAVGKYLRLSRWWSIWLLDEELVLFCPLRYHGAAACRHDSHTVTWWTLLGQSSLQPLQDDSQAVTQMQQVCCCREDLDDRKVTFDLPSFNSVTKPQLLSVRINTKPLRCKSDLEHSVLAWRKAKTKNITGIAVIWRTNKPLMRMAGRKTRRQKKKKVKDKNKELNWYWPSWLPSERYSLRGS